MDEILGLWRLWAQGTVPPEKVLWGLELYWWNRLGVAVQSIALVILFFELIGSEGRQKIVGFFGSKAYETMTQNIANELTCLYTHLRIGILSIAILPAWLVVSSLQKQTNRFDKIFRGKNNLQAKDKSSQLQNWLNDLEMRDAIFAEQLAETANIEYNTVSFFSGKVWTFFRWFVAFVLAIVLNDVFFDADPFYTPSAALIGYCLLVPMGWTNHVLFNAVTWAPFSGIKIIYYCLRPIFKRFFDEKYDRHWLTAALIGSAFSLHFSILIG